MAKDNVLIARAQAGDEQAFADLMRAYYAFVYAIVIEMVNNPHDAEEIVQETFLSTYRGLLQLEEATKFKSWLAEIARNRARDWLRKQRVDTVPIDEVSEHTLQTPDTSDEQLIRDEARERIRRAMETLSQKDRDIARSYYLDGASYDELIRSHGLSYKAVSVRLSRAKRTLTKRLQYLLTGLSIPPATTLKQIYSGGLTAMKIGTAHKSTAGAIGVVALVFIGFIGIRQITAPTVEQRVYLVPEKGKTVDTPNKTEQWVAQKDTTSDTAIRENQTQTVTEEIDFFAQPDQSDTQPEETDTGQSTESEFQRDTDENVITDTNTFAEDTEQSAEEVMNAFVEGFKRFDLETLLPLLTGRAKEEFEEDYIKGIQIPENIPDEMREMVKQQIVDEVVEVFSGMEVVSSEYVGDEFHFRVRWPPPEPRELLHMNTSEGSHRIYVNERPAPEASFKMRKMEGEWFVYDGESLN